MRSAALRAKPISWVTTIMVMPSVGEGDHGVEHFVDHFGVERAGGLVEEHDLGLHGEGAGDGDALLLTAGKLGGHFVRLGIHADLGEQLHGFGFCLRLGDFADAAGAEGHVIEDGLVREEVVGLENHADFCAELGEGAAFFGQFLSVNM